jgi:phosphate-selective porin
MIDLNDQLVTANGVAGGKQTVHTAGLNWYVNRNVRFMFNFLHGDIAKQASATNVGDVGRSSTRSQCGPTSHSRQNKNGYVCASL